MIYEWVGKSLPLREVASQAKVFFEMKGFMVAIDRDDQGWLISAMKKVNRKKQIVFVNVYGCPSDFFIKFDASGHGRTLGLFGNTVSLSGFGFLSLLSIDSSGFLENIEEGFWPYMDDFLREHGSERRVKDPTKA